MVPVDPSKIKPGTRVLLKDGETVGVRGCYMSADGLVLMVDGPTPAVQRNVPLALVVGMEG